ncbi:MAG: hypothetical protein GWN14_05305, partial [candidate division Zixibacteria bacterium]|nr:hypothetical protein [candidate division Zixibacteria bacterium]
MTNAARKIISPEPYEYWDTDLEFDNSDKAKQKASEQNGIGMIEGTGMNLRRITSNGALYRERVFRKVLPELRAIMDEGKIVGLFGHPMPAYLGASARPSDVAVRWTVVSLDRDANVHVEGVILNTRAGRDLLATLEGGVRLGLSSRFNVLWEFIEKMDDKDPDWIFNKEKKGKGFHASKEIQLPGGWDVVITPSNANAWLDEEISEHLRRAHGALNYHPEEDEMPWDKIKNWEDFETAAPASVRDMIVKAVTDIIRPDIESEVTEVMTEKAQTDLEAALGDTEKVCESLEITAEQLSFVKKNSDHIPALEKLIGVGLDITKLAAQEPVSSEQITEIEQMNVTIQSLESKVTSLEREAADAKALLAARDANDALEEMLKKHTVGEPGSEHISELARKDLKPGATEDAVKAAIESAKSFLERAGASFAPTNGRGRTGPDASGSRDAGVENIVTRR